MWLMTMYECQCCCACYHGSASVASCDGATTANMLTTKGSFTQSHTTSHISTRSHTVLLCRLFVPKDLSAEQRDLLEEVRSLGIARWVGAEAQRRFVRVDQATGQQGKESGQQSKESRQQSKESGAQGSSEDGGETGFGKDEKASQADQGKGKGKKSKGWWPLS